MSPIRPENRARDGAKPCARCHHPKSRHRTRECRQTWQTRGQTFMGISTITKWCTCDGYQPPTANTAKEDR